MADIEKMAATGTELAIANGTEEAIACELDPLRKNNIQLAMANDREQVKATSNENVEIDTRALIEELGKSFHELQTFKNAAIGNVQWMEIVEYFRNLETNLKKKLEELEAKEKIYEEKEAECRAWLAEREVAFAAKEQDLVDRVQKLKDAAVAVIADVRGNYWQISADSGDVEEKKDDKVSCSLGDTNSSQENISNRLCENAENKALMVKPRPELIQLCEQMDAKGLLKFIMENKKNLHAIRAELSIALENATDPARLVLDSLEACYPPHEINHPGDKRDAALQGMQKTCITIMEAMFAFVARVDPSSDNLLNSETKQRAKAVANEWKPRLATVGNDAASENSLEAKAFLILLATFRIASDYDEEELCKLVLAVPYFRQRPELCRSLGLTHKMPGVVELLINSDKQIDAVHLIHAFQLTEKFPPVPLLKTYLKDRRQDSQGKGGRKGSAEGQNDGNAQELAALKEVIKCIKEYKLEADYPLDSLQKRTAQLEKSKLDKKRGRESKYQKRKKAKAEKGFHGSQAPVAAGSRQTPPVFGERPAYEAMSQRFPHVGPMYQYPGQPTYAHQVHDPRLYHHPQDERTASTSYSALPSSYGNYMGGGRLPSSYRPY